MKAFSSALLTLAMAASITASDAQAVVAARRLSGTAVSSCQTSLPVFDGQVRKRPLAIQNEGASSAFVTCSLIRHFNSSSVMLVQLFAENKAATAQDLTCTLVAGTATSIDNQFVSQTVTLPAGESGMMFWNSGHFDGGVFPDTQYSMSCNLLPGVGLNETNMDFEEEVGAA